MARIKEGQDEIEYREDLAVLKYWRDSFKTEKAKKAVEKIMYFVIVNRHRNMFQVGYTCAVCGKRAYSGYCVRHKPKKPVNRLRRPRKAGKHSELWAEFRKQWLIDNPPPYICGICGRAVHPDSVVLDHIIPRSNRPDLRYNSSNIQPAHWACNGDKGSKHATGYTDSGSGEAI